MAAEAGGEMAAVLAAIEAQRRPIRESAMVAIREVELERDDKLRKLDGAVGVLDGVGADRRRRGVSATAGADKPAEPMRPRKAKTATTPAAVRKRCVAVFRYLSEQEEPVARHEILRALRITPHSLATALSRLIEEGKATRTGSGRGTRYRVKADGSAVPGATSSVLPFPERGTLQGRLLATIKDRGSASLEELVQATGASREEVLKACGALVAEEEIRMGRRNGRPVYVIRVAA
jgi:hypothetical protein